MMEAFLSGAIVMGFATAGLLFLRAWRRTREKLFRTFAASFFLLAINYLGLATTLSKIRARPCSSSRSSDVRGGRRAPS